MEKITPFALTVALVATFSCQEVAVLATEEMQYCSFFNNRAPEAQPGLQNCTWFKAKSCCQQQEIAATFGSVKPLKGASPSCQKYINYLMCYICAPNQNIYYQNERLTVCLDFCDSLYEACNSAVLKGSVIKDLYSSGLEFCESRRFHVEEQQCFAFNEALDSTSNAARISSPILLSYFSLFLATETLCFGLASTMKSLFVHIRHFILFMAVFSLMECSGAVTTDDTDIYAEHIYKELGKLAKDGLKYKELQELYDDADYSMETVNGTEKVLQIRDRLASFFTSKRLLAEELAAEAQRLHSQFIDSRGPEELLSEHLNDLSFAVYMDTDILHRLPIDMMAYDHSFKRHILANYSALKIPDDVSRSNRKVIETAVWSSHLNAMFQRNLKADPRIRWQYFASTTGLFRTFPAAEWERNFIGFHEDFDARMRPWYIAATSEPKNIVIVIDASLSMAENGRLERAKKVASTIVSKLSRHDFVNVIVSKSHYWTPEGTFINSTSSVLHCQDQGLVPASANHQNMLITAIEDISAGGGSDHVGAFSLAYDLLRKHRSKDHSHCQSYLLFITDGQQRDRNLRCSKGYYRYHYDAKKKFIPGKHCSFTHESVVDYVTDEQVVGPARIFSFLVDIPHDPDEGVLSELLACRHGGSVSHVTNDTEILQQMDPYFNFVHKTSKRKHTIWSSPYVDNSGLGLMITVVSPVYNNKTDELLGVVGIDVPLSHVDNQIRHSLWGSAHTFLVDAKDSTVLLHPLLKSFDELTENALFIPVSYLATHNNLPADFQGVLDGITSKTTGKVRITNDAVQVTRLDGHLSWLPLRYSNYYFSAIPDSDFVIVLHMTPEDEEFKHARDPENVATSYLHELPLYNQHRLDIPGAYEELAPQDDFYKFRGLLMTYEHSVVSIAPRAFCYPSMYLEEGKPSFVEMHDFINSQSEAPPCPKGIFRSETRPDVKLTSIMEQLWKSRQLYISKHVSKHVTWTYVGTQSGVFRIYPGVQMARNYDPTRRPWYTHAQAHPGILTLSSPYLDNQHSDGQLVVTLAQTIHKGRPLTPPDCTGSKRGYGCPCNGRTHCDSNFCLHGNCADETLQAVVAMDIPYPEFKDLINTFIKYTPVKGKKCGQKYLCGYPPVQCTVRCHLLDDKADFMIHHSFDAEVLSSVNSHNHPLSMASQYGYITQLLLAEGILIQESKTDFQGVCHISEDIPQPRVLITSHEDERIPGPVPPFQNNYSCNKQKTYLRLNATKLEEAGGTVAGSLANDPCAQGNFFFTSIEGTNLFFLIIYDYFNNTHLPFNLNCRLYSRVLQPRSAVVNQQVCFNRFSDEPSPDARVCQPQTATHVPCVFNSSPSFRSVISISVIMISANVGQYL